ncbi:MAG: hypothetical protein II839_04135, partial [Kiritimatiellae bacterium]|nr:hypothetical protein [Kiritimatiellia bacterium]
MKSMKGVKRFLGGSCALRHNSCYPNRDGELLGCATIGVTENCGAMNMTNDEKKTNHRLMRR